MFVRSKTYIGFGIFFLLASLYSLMGVMQAASLFVGERALANANFWGSVGAAFLSGSIYCFSHSQAIKPKTNAHPEIKAVIGLLVLICGAWFAWPVVTDVFSIDKCLDSGGSFNHVLSQCDFSKNHPSLSTFKRQGFRVVMFLLSLVIAIKFAMPYVRNYFRRREHAL